MSTSDQTRFTFGDLSPKFVAQILNDEKWYKNGDPQWRNSRSRGQAKRAWVDDVERLSRFGRRGLCSYCSCDVEPITALKLGIENCVPSKRCKDGGCAKCQRALQRWFVSTVGTLIADMSKGEKLVALSLVPKNGRAARTDLRDIDFQAFKKNIYDGIKNSGLKWAILGVDLSLNESLLNEQHWQAQFYGFGSATATPKSVSKRLRLRFLPSEGVQRPVRTDVCDGSPYALSYAYKTRFWRRVSYRDDSATRPCVKSRNLSLKAADHIRALLKLSELGLGGRLLLCNLKPVLSGKEVTMRYAS